MFIQISDPLKPEIEKPTQLAIGIDFGTTHCVAAVIKNGRAETIPLNDDGTDLLPSVIKVENNKLQISSDRTSGVSSIKRIMGRSFKEVIAVYPSYENVIKDSDNGIKIKTDIGYKAPIELAASIFKHIKSASESHLQQAVSDAVVTVPAYFDDTARASIRDAAKLAGLNVLRLIAEPTSAALAYGLDTAAEGNYIVYDLGGGTFDVSVLNLTQGVFQVLATGGNPLLGGDDIDEIIVEHFRLTGLTYSERKKAALSAKNVKEKLSQQLKATFESPKSDRSVLTREQLERLIFPWVTQTCDIVQNTLRNAEVTLSEIQSIILVGGSTRIPLIKQELNTTFQLPIHNNIDPDRVVALGAAHQASALKVGSDNILIDVTPLSLGVEMMGGVVEKIIHRNTPLPIQKSQDFTTFKDNQTGLVIHVLQGERELALDCRSLGKITLSGIPPMPAGMVKVRVNFMLDADGLLTVKAKEETSGVSQKIQVKPTYGLSENVMAEMILESQRLAQHDMSQRLLKQSKTVAQQLLNTTQAALQKDGDLLLKSELSTIKNALSNLTSSLQHEDRNAILVATETLNQATLEFAHKRVQKYLNA